MRHAYGYALANNGHDTRADPRLARAPVVTSTAVYTALAPNRFKSFWRDYRGRQADFRGAAS
jgi:site-specific recombinase XerD